MKILNKKFGLSLLACVGMLSTKAQFLELEPVTSGGVTNVNYNPAIADSRYLVDINLFTTDITAANSYIGIKGKLLDFKNGWNSDLNLAEKLNGKISLGMPVQQLNCHYPF